MSCHLRQKTLDNILVNKSFEFITAAGVLLGFSPLVLYPEEQAAAYAVEMLERIFSWATAYQTADLSKVKYNMNLTDEIVLGYVGAGIRNRLWVNKIVKQCEQNANCLIVAGARHMAYDSQQVKSVSTLLRERGFTVELVE